MNQKNSGKKNGKGNALIVFGVFLFVFLSQSLESLSFPGGPLYNLRLRWILFRYRLERGEPKELTVVAVVAAVIILAVVLLLKRKRSAAVHTHDRIDHSTDIVIDPTTGKTVSRAQKSSAPHSARQHWKQQMDQLLANGTIDKDEYRAMMNRKFK